MNVPGPPKTSSVSPPVHPFVRQLPVQQLVYPSSGPSHPSQVFGGTPPAENLDGQYQAGFNQPRLQLLNEQHQPGFTHQPQQHPPIYQASGAPSGHNQQQQFNPYSQQQKQVSVAGEYNATLAAEARTTTPSQNMSKQHMPSVHQVPPGPTQGSGTQFVPQQPQMYPQQSGPRPQTPQMQTRQSLPPQNMQMRQQRPIAMATTPGQMYNAGTQPMQQASSTTMFMPGQVPSYMGGSQVITMSGPPATGIPPMPFQPTMHGNQRLQGMSYTMASSQSTFTVSPAGPTYYAPPGQASGNPSQVFYPQMVNPQPRHATSNQSYQKRERKMLTITDPNTGKDISEEIRQNQATKTSATPPQPDSGSRATPVTSANSPPPSQGQDIAAKFAAQVALAIQPGEKQGQGGQPTPPQQQQQQPAMAQQTASQMTQSAPQQARPNAQMPVTAYQAPQDVRPSVTQQLPVQEQLPVDQSRTGPDGNLGASVPSEQSAEVPKPRDSPVADSSAAAEESQSPVQDDAKPQPDSNDDVEAAPEKTVEPTAKIDETAHSIAATATDETSDQKVESLPHSTDNLGDKLDVVDNKTENTPSTDDKKLAPDTLTKSEKPESSANESEEVLAKELSGIDESSESQEADISEDASGKKNKNKKKFKDFNQRPDQDGSDMDAFYDASSKTPVMSSSDSSPMEDPMTTSKTDESPEQPPAPTPPVTTAAAAEEATASDRKEEEKVVVVESTPAVEQTSDVIDSEPSTEGGDKDMVKVEVTVEDKTVSEKNERNEELQRNGEIGDEDETSTDTASEQAKPVIKTDAMELKYSYREDQWSPLNTEGKKHYDRNFLLQLQFSSESLEKPNNLPKLPDVILDAPYGGRNDQQQLSRGIPQSKMMDFTPGYIVKSSPGGNKGPPKRSSQQKRDGRSAQKVITIPLQTDVKLNRVENAWKPSHKANETGEEDEELFRKIRSNLNKLTPQKFQTLVNQTIELGINTESKLKGTIDIVFEKAISEPSFSVAYANMCKCMMNLKVASQTKPEEFVAFRNLLLNRCQMEFEKDKADEADKILRLQEIEEAPEDKKKELVMEMEDKEKKNKRRSLGNIRFIGELFKLKMLTEKIMHECLMKLLRQSDEEDLECLCRLLTTIGKEIDNEKAKQRVDQYFQRMDKIIKLRNTSSRTRFMLQDVVELRANNWVPRREDKGPKTIEQVHRDAEQESIMRAAEVQRASIEGPKRMTGRPPPAGRGQNTVSDDGWQVKSTRAPIDPNRMRISKPTMGENIQLGPGGRGMGSWARGSSGGSKPTSQESERPSAPSNRFMALSSEGDSRGRGSGRGSMQPPASTRDTKGARLSQGRETRRVTGRQSQEQDREAALAAARNLARTPSGSRNQSRESSRNRERERSRESQRPPAGPPADELSPEKMEFKTKSLLDEFLSINDQKEAEACVRELKSPGILHLFVYNALNHVIERSQKARQQTGHLMSYLLKMHAITQDHYVKGVKEVLEFAEDIAIDIPQIWDYMAEFISPVIEEGSLPLAQLLTLCDPLIPTGKAGVLTAKTLHDMAHRLGHIKVGEMWQASGLSWKSFVHNTNISEFIQQHKLEFTVSQEEPKTAAAGQKLSMDVIAVEIDKLIKKGTSNEDIFDWVKRNVGSDCEDSQFTRALMTSVCNEAIIVKADGNNKMEVDSDQLKKRCLLLQRYLDHKLKLELQALYALQAVVHAKDHPASVLRTFFDILYDEDIISEDAFYKWEKSTDPQEKAGKGVAQTSVTQFFTWLREAEDEEQD